MEKEESRAPDFKGDGIAVWKNNDKNGKVYLSIKILGDLTVRAWKNEPKDKIKVREEL